MKNLIYIRIGAIIVLALLVSLLISCDFTEYQSNGERIYFTAESSSGQPIIRIGGFMMMHRITCVNCHGEDGKGGAVFLMMSYIEVPDITWHELTGPHESHQPYTEETIKQAIIDGVEPNGEELDFFMPRWQMTDEDLDDLVEYIKTLE